MGKAQHRDGQQYLKRQSAIVREEAAAYWLMATGSWLLPQRPARRLYHLRHDLPPDRIDLVVGQRAFGRLQRNFDRDRFLVGAQRVALEKVEDRNSGNQLLVGALGGAQHYRRVDRAVEQEGEVAPD